MPANRAEMPLTCSGTFTRPPSRLPVDLATLPRNPTTERRSSSVAFGGPAGSWYSVQGPAAGGAAGAFRRSSPPSTSSRERTRIGPAAAGVWVWYSSQGFAMLFHRQGEPPILRIGGIAAEESVAVLDRADRRGGFLRRGRGGLRSGSLRRAFRRPHIAPAAALFGLKDSDVSLEGFDQIVHFGNGGFGRIAKSREDLLILFLVFLAKHSTL